MGQTKKEIEKETAPTGNKIHFKAKSRKQEPVLLRGACLLATNSINMDN